MSSKVHNSNSKVQGGYDNNTNTEDTNINLKYKAELIQLRRNKVMELYARGYSQNRIAKTLGVDQSLISLDISCIKEQATTNLATHIHETIPLQYERCLSGLNQVLELTWD
jgi:transcriptional regulator